MQIETERLRIYPVSDDRLKEIVDAETNPELKQAYNEMLQGCLLEPENRIWHTVWLIVLRNQAETIVGDLSFKGMNADGMVELGYGLREGFCGNGYMTEAVRAISAWALEQNGVSRVEAETEPENQASQNVLFRSGYVPTGKNGDEGPRFLYSQGGSGGG